jgi:hypothetical protein
MQHGEAPQFFLRSDGAVAQDDGCGDVLPNAV